MSNRYLPTALRRSLEKTIRDARVIAEEGATDAIRRLGIAESKAPAFLNDEEKELRRRLRAHARALGDQFDRDSERQETKRLIEAAAYAHWHRMLFARFLADRGLLRHPTHNAPVTLEDCRDFAKEEGLPDEWAVAERYAAAMLPAVFHIDDPVLALELDPAHGQGLQRLVRDLDAEIFQAEDSLGWTYQFWRAAEKRAVNESGVKIGADELPAVTQLFTEPYLVRFLLHNTLGAWWAGKRLAADPSLAEKAADEEALRAACELPGYSFDMLRFVREEPAEGRSGDNRWRPAAGTFPGWPRQAAAITVLDPCCGSGHFLTEALRILVALRQAEEGLTVSDTVAAVLQENLFGLEIDGRCVQIAAFAVALNAWAVGGWQTLPLPHVAWVGSPRPLDRQEFLALAESNNDLHNGLSSLYDVFSQGHILGSLIEPRGGDLGDSYRLGNIEPLLDKLLQKARTAYPEVTEGAIAARGMADAANLLSRRYILLITNVPFLGRGKQADDLADFIARFYPDGKADLATTMLMRMEKLTDHGGTVAAVTPQNWLFLSSYENLRIHFLEHLTLNAVAIIGEGGFESASAAGAFTALVTLTATKPSDRSTFSGLDASGAADPAGKAEVLQMGQARVLKQNQQRKNPDSIISLTEAIRGNLLENYASVLVGVSTADSPQYIMKFWEWRNKGRNWEYFQTTVRETQTYGGMTDSILWEKESGKLARFAESVKHLNHNVQNWRRGKPNWGRRGISVSMMRELDASLYTGERYDTNCCAIVPHDDSDLSAFWSYCSSDEFHRNVRSNNKNIKIEVGTILSSKFDIEHWKEVAVRDFPNGVPEPYSNDPTQWLFHGHPAEAERGSALHVALARLCGYRWPAESDLEMRLSAEARECIAQLVNLPDADNDGLLAVPAVTGEMGLTDRLRKYLSASFGSECSDALERRLVAEADEVLDKKATRDGTLEAWVRDRAFRQHCVLFHQRPFIWHIWDGLKEGFSVFVHYHRFDQAALRKLTYTVLGDWLTRAKAESNDVRYEKGRELQQKLERILEGESPYDIFVRWKPLAELPIGWAPDLDDGVRMNIRPFVLAAVFRETPKIKWTKDRGNDVTSAPWYEVFKGERINDHHTTIAEKQAAHSAAPKRREGAK